VADTIFWISGEDQEMGHAIAAAQATFNEFARNAELDKFRLIPAFSNASIKAFFPHPRIPGRGEHMFVTDISVSGKAVTGTLASAPNDIPGLRADQEVTVPLANVSDWFLVPNDEKGIGGFTVDVMKSQLPADQLAEWEQYPPMAWYRHRTNTDARAELDAVPVCRQCGVRDLLGRPYQKGVCGWCSNNFVRCACPECGAPLFRQPDAPRECHRCLSAKSE
jgi:uncharacterized protein YegJ (DUF2314 family)